MVGDPQEWRKQRARVLESRQARVVAKGVLKTIKWIRTLPTS